jgi:hypothetical protein
LKDEAAKGRLAENEIHVRSDTAGKIDDIDAISSGNRDVVELIGHLFAINEPVIVKAYYSACQHAQQLRNTPMELTWIYNKTQC